MSRPLRVALFLALALITSLAYGHGRPALAATFTVNDTADAVDANPGDGVCETAAGNGVCTLRAAIMETNALPGADAITLPPGLYKLTLVHTTCGKAAELEGAIGALWTNGDLTIDGAGADETVIESGGTCDSAFWFAGSVVRISGVSIQGGSSFFGGGGIGDNYGALTLDQVSIQHNAGALGGAISNHGTLTVTNSTISNNWADEGGAIGNRFGSVSIDDSTISNNRATYGAGAIFNEGGPPVSISDSTIAGNTTTTIGGIKGWALAGGLIQIRNTIVANGSGSWNCGSMVVSLGYNLADDDSCSLTGPGDVNNTDPKLGPLANNGGPTQTHALLPGSPAIDAGSSDCPPPATDQRGVARPQGSACDIGAFEWEAGQQVLWGDVQCSGAVDSVDALGDLRALAHLPPLPHADGCPEIGTTVDVTGFSPHAWGDVDCEGNVNSIDALRILRYVAHLSLSPVAGCPDMGAEVTIS